MNNDKLSALRHTAEHVLMQAMDQLFPGKIIKAMGPATDDGFYFDFDTENDFKISELDFETIERKAYLAYFRDGLWELGLGLYFLVFGLLMRTDIAGLSGALFLVIYFVIVMAAAMLLKLDPSVAFLGYGAQIVLLGSYYLMTFIRGNPILEDEPVPEERNSEAVPEPIDRLVHEPARLKILSLLYVVDSANFIFLLKQTGLIRGNLSSHLSKLEEGGYMSVTKEFVDRKPHTLLALTEEGAKALQAYRKKLERIFNGLPR